MTSVSYYSPEALDALASNLDRACPDASGLAEHCEAVRAASAALRTLSRSLASSAAQRRQEVLEAIRSSMLAPEEDISEGVHLEGVFDFEMVADAVLVLPHQAARVAEATDRDEDAVEAVAMALSKFIGYAWEGLRSDGRIVDHGYKLWTHNGAGHLSFQGRQEDLRDVARDLLGIAQNATAVAARAA